MAATADSLFRTVFLPLYPADARGDLARARREDANPANNPSLLAHLEDAAKVFADNAPAALGVTLDFTDASVHRLSAALTPERRDALAAAGELFDVVVHGAAYVGACVVRHHGGAWAVRRPLWESLVRLSSRAGEAELAVFHWLLKSLADDARATLADRYRAHVELPTARPEELPVIADADRRIPRLAKPRYDTLHKTLKAHLPELRDLGDDFPSPERFAELGLTSLSFVLAGGGRMLVMWGPSASGLHAFWLTTAGFEKAAFWPCDAFPEPIVRAEGDKLAIILSRDGAARSFEILWWGP